MSITMFLVIVAITLVITYWAARRTKTTAEFYAAGRSISAWQNGVAVAGDYMSAASFLGIAGIIALSGYDGFMYSVGWLVAYLTVLLVVAEPLRNSGKYTMADILAYRVKEKPARTVAATSTLIVSLVYMMSQMIGAGAIVKLLFGLDSVYSIVIIGVLMMLYVVFGGMLATTWVQIVKAILLMAGTVVLSIMVLAHYGFHFSDFLADAASKNGGLKFLGPGLRFTNPLDQISLAMALILGTAGLPHILVRFYTVPDAKAARKSVVWAMGLIGAFYIMTTFLGFGAAALVGKQAIVSADKAGNMAAPLLAQVLGGGKGTLGGDLFLAFIAAVAFATILAVVAGLTVASSSAFAHDIYVNVIKNGQASEQEQVKVARYTALGIGVLAIVLGILLRGFNVAYAVSLAFAIAASANLPAILFSLFWKRFNTGGVVWGMSIGLIVSILAVAIGPSVMGKAALFPLANPGIVTIPIGFLAAYLGTIFTSEPQSQEKFNELLVRANTGLNAE